MKRAPPKDVCVVAQTFIDDSGRKRVAYLRYTHNPHTQRFVLRADICCAECCEAKKLCSGCEAVCGVLSLRNGQKTLIRRPFHRGFGEIASERDFMRDARAVMTIEREQTQTSLETLQAHDGSLLNYAAVLPMHVSPGEAQKIIDEHRCWRSHEDTWYEQENVA